MTHVITQPCIGVNDASCVEVCPEDCIYGKDEGWEILAIHPLQCTDCGLCVDACPVEAIFPRDEVPARWREFVGRSYRRFGLEPPG